MVVGLMVGMSGCGGDSPTGEEPRELLVWTTTYDDGSVKEEYQYYHHPKNNRRIKNWWYNSYYENGEYHETGRYKDAERDGEWVEYDETGTPIDENIYREGLCVESCDWRKTFGYGEGFSVQETVDGRFIITGWDENFVGFLLKTDGQGNEKWRKTFGEGWGSSVQQTVDGGFIITGYSGGIFLLKTDDQGNEEWKKTLGEGDGR